MLTKQQEMHTEGAGCSLCFAVIYPQQLKQNVYDLIGGRGRGYEALLSFLLRYVCSQAARSADEHN